MVFCVREMRGESLTSDVIETGTVLSHVGCLSFAPLTTHAPLSDKAPLLLPSKSHHRALAAVTKAFFGHMSTSPFTQNFERHTASIFVLDYHVFKGSDCFRMIFFCIKLCHFTLSSSSSSGDIIFVSSL